MTLTEVNYYTRRLAPVGIILILVILIFYFAFRLFLAYIGSGTPGQSNGSQIPLAINPVFEKITVPNIPNARAPSAELNYVLDTFDGTTNFENATSAAAVYFLPKATSSFGFVTRIYNMAKAVGINTEVTQYEIEGDTAIFDDNIHTLSVDTASFNYEYRYDFEKEAFPFSNQNQPSEDSLRNSASDFLRRLNRYPQTLAQGKQNVTYIDYNTETQQITFLDQPQGANMAEVDFYRADINGYPTVTSSYFNSPHFVLYAFTTNSVQPIRAQVVFFERSDEQVGIYPLRTPDQAWKDLQEGKGYIISSPENVQEVRVQKVFMGYYDPGVYQEYLQPVYVFLAENKFVAYVPAVSEEYLIRE